MKADLTMLALREPKIEVTEGVYVPAEDSRLLRDAFRRRGPAAPADVLDMCTGSGYQAIAAAIAGHRVVAVDSEIEAVHAARRNAFLSEVEIEVVQGDLFEPVGGWVFDAILANPPYVPTAEGTERTAWCDGGPDGRAVIDRICQRASGMLRVGGRLWMVHSSLANIPHSVAMLEAHGLECGIVDQRELELGPVSRARIDHLVSGGHIAAGDHHERLAVIVAKKIDG